MELAKQLVPTEKPLRENGNKIQKINLLKIQTQLKMEEEEVVSMMPFLLSACILVSEKNTDKVKEKKVIKAE